VKHVYIIYTIAATEKHARECGIPLLERGRQEVEEGSARDAIEAFLGDNTKDVYIPVGDFYDTAVAYERHDPKRPIIWLAIRIGAGQS
jgi:hypothetical protein